MPDTAGNALATTYADFTPDFEVTAIGDLVAEGFSRSPFGEKDWIFETMWKTLTTSAMRAADVRGGEYQLRRWQYALGRVVNDRRRLARDFNLHDALTTTTAYATVAVATIAAEATDVAGVVTLVDDGATYADRELVGVCPGWTFVDHSGARFPITAVRKDFAKNTIRADGAVYTALYEWDIAADIGDVTTGADCVFEPPSMLALLAEQYGVALIAGLVEGNQRDIVYRAEYAWRQKGSIPGLKGYAHARGFDLAVAGLTLVGAERRAQIEAVDPAYIKIGYVPWEGFCIAGCDGTAQALDSSAANDTLLLGVPDATPGRTYATARALGDGMPVEIMVKAPAADGDDGDLYVTYTIVVDGERKTFRARDRRVSATVGDLIPLSAEFATLNPTARCGRFSYSGDATQRIAVLAVDQSVLDGTVTYGAFIGPVVVDFTSARYYVDSAVAPPAIARFDEIAADSIAADTYQWMSPTDYDFALTVTTLTLATAPYSTSSVHVVRVTYTSGLSPIPVDGTPVGRWKLTDGVDEWWVESRTSVTPAPSAVDDLTVVGTLPPVNGITTLTLVPKVVPSASYAPARCMSLTTTAIGGFYTSPSVDHAEEAVSVLDSLDGQMVPAAAVAAIKEQ
jgi:hypothetical protein